MKGVTLIETVVYIALLSILMTGTLATSFSFLEGASNNSEHATTQEEGNFVMRKLDWVLDDMESASYSGGKLTVYKAGYGGSYPIVFQKNGSTLLMSENGGSNYALTTTNVSVGAFVVDVAPGLCGALGGVIATTTIGGQDFTVTKCKH